MRWCSECEDYLQETEFYKDKRVSDGLTRRCKSHHSSKSYESRIKNQIPKEPHDRYLYHRELNLKKNFGITIEQYEEILSGQNYLCKICGKPETDTYKGRIRQLSVDHDHKTGKVRGLLCVSCNTGLGKFYDNPEIILNAYLYLNVTSQNTCCE